jgi:hypothetical protein
MRERDPKLGEMKRELRDVRESRLCEREEESVQTLTHVYIREHR